MNELSSNEGPVSYMLAADLLDYTAEYIPAE